MKKFFVICGLIVLSLGFAASLADARDFNNRVVRTQYANGRLRTETGFKNGRIIFSRTFHASGKLLKDYRYRNGQPYYKRNFYANGRVRNSWTLKSRKLIHYDINGGVVDVIQTNGTFIETQ